MDYDELINLFWIVFYILVALNILVLILFLVYYY